SYRLSTSKIVVTSRSGDYHRHLEGFRVLELCPLKPAQTREIAEKWLRNPDEFIDLLMGLPYQDLADRPLLLCQLIVLFRRQGTLPDQPFHVARRLLRLLLEDWDKERGVSRESRYSGFDPDRKADFLSALAYNLTYRLRATAFTIADLSQVYRQIHQLFGLPSSEAEKVAEEIASHTGLVTASGDGFEFSHLSFQEYLCASHLVREPFPENLNKYMADYSAPIAVAVAISASPGNWLAGLILRPELFLAFSRESLQSFLARLRVEHPLFDTTVALGIATMFLFEHSAQDRRLRENLLFLFENQAVLESIRHALPYYFVPYQKQGRDGEVILQILATPKLSIKARIPATIALPDTTVVRLLGAYPMLIRVRDGNKTLGKLSLNQEGKLDISSHLG
ncbi:MAG TPA: hypothetical protein VGO40_22875, partial [Longimicrobium sp.]|nr:hypothetical protein [Longimicrobium sp.]